MKRTMLAPTMLALAALVAAAGCRRPFAPEGERAARGANGEAARSAAARGWMAWLRFSGATVSLDRNLEPRPDRPGWTDVLAPGPEGAPPDTVPAFARLEWVRWRPAAAGRSEPPAAGRAGRGEGDDPHAREPGPAFAPGHHEMVLTAPAHAGGGTVTARFFSGFVPGVWWAGPDPDRWPAASDGDGRAVDVTDWASLATVPAWPPDGRATFGADSFRVIPSRRAPVGGNFDRRTFYEIHGNRIYAREENDTVHRGAWIVVSLGGYDRDSPYSPLVDPLDPALPAGYAADPGRYPVLNPAGLEGSPIGFRVRVSIKLPDGRIVRLPAGPTFPNFDPTSVFRQPQVLGYWPAQLEGRAYVEVRAVDAHGLLSPALPDPVALADRVDAGGGTPRERLERRRILTFRIAAPAQARTVAAN